MKSRSWILLLCLWPLRAQAQITVQQPASDAVRVYLDCSGYCDSNFIRSELNYVNWVRDRADAQVHVIVSRQNTGGGGKEYELTFTGLRRLAGRQDTLHYTTRSTDSDDLIRQGLTRALTVGLVPFIARTVDGLSSLRVSWAPPEKPNGERAAPVRDPWNFWVISLTGRVNMSGESSSGFSNFGGNLSANRTTDAFKIRLGLNGRYRDSRFTYQTDGGADTTVVSIEKNYSLSLLAVKSYSSHWSAGFFTQANSATYGNIEFGYEAGPALEYSFWPYRDATRRALTFRYSLGVSAQSYRQLTIYGQMAETHPKHSFAAQLDLRQRFGSVSFETDFEQYLHDTAFYSASLATFTNIKLFKGFSLNVSGHYERVRDQLSLEAGNLTPEEVLLQQKQQRTGYRYSASLGIGYSFGSIFNNVVNPRFGD